MDKAIAVIVGGGKGTRIASVAEGRPKLLMPIGARSLLSRHLALIARANIVSQVYVLTSDRSEAIDEALRDEGVGTDAVSIVTEPSPLGPAGYLGAMLASAKGPALVIFGDVLSNLNFDEVLEFHCDRRADATIVVRQTDHPEDSDLVEVTQNRIKRIWQIFPVKPVALVSEDAQMVPDC